MAGFYIGATTSTGDITSGVFSTTSIGSPGTPYVPPSDITSYGLYYDYGAGYTPEVACQYVTPTELSGPSGLQYSLMCPTKAGSDHIYFPSEYGFPPTYSTLTPAQYASDESGIDPHIAVTPNYADPGSPGTPSTLDTNPSDLATFAIDPVDLVVTASATATVPEPGTLALLFAGVTATRLLRRGRGARPAIWNAQS